MLAFPGHAQETDGWFEINDFSKGLTSHVSSFAVQTGATPLIAAMRAFVAGKYGDEVGDD